MRGLFFQKPLEYQLNIQGESWNQGDTLTGNLVIKNHDSVSVTPNPLLVSFALGKIKDVASKKLDSFQIIENIQLAAVPSIEPSTTVTLDWTLKTNSNCPVTDVSVSPYILYGSEASRGHLQLLIKPHSITQEFIKILEVYFRFVVKFIKTKKQGIEIKMQPPSDKSFAMVESLFIGIQFNPSGLEIEYQFNIKKIDATVGMQLQKVKRDFSQSFLAHEYRLPNGRIDHDRMEGAIREVLSQIASKLAF
jgi:hypothetical protein